MNRPKYELKKRECLEHREYVYQKALGRVLSGELPPEYLRERWDKIKQVRRK
jgi:hypothetical protein